MTTLNIPIDEKVEKEAEELFSDFGLDIPTAVNIFCGSPFVKTVFPSTLSGKFQMPTRSLPCEKQKR